MLAYSVLNDDNVMYLVVDNKNHLVNEGMLVPTPIKKK